jgi:hypothetical protein
MSLEPQYLPSGTDRADGLAGRPGTPTPANTVLVTTPDKSGIILEESATSPEIERAEQGTIRHTFRMDADTANLFIQAYGRGKFLLDSNGNVTRVVSAALAQMKGDQAQFSVTEESISFDNPPDEFEVEEVEMNPALEKHPRYLALRQFNLQLEDPATGVLIPIDETQLTGFDILLRIHQAASAPSASSQDDSTLTLDDFSAVSPSSAQILLNLANELTYKLRQGQETFYLSGWRITWSSYFWRPSLLNPGGYIEDPVTSGYLPAYFWSDVGDGSFDGIVPDVVNNNIFLQLANIANPNIYQYGLSWLRTSDKMSYQRTWFRLTRTWLAAPLGHWDRSTYDRNVQTPYPVPPLDVIV